MAWSLSRFRAGDLVEVRSKEEILATLDPSGCVEAMPFMPEMLQYCGRRFQVSAVAHKTCDTACYTGGRRLQSMVHLAGVRCDGSSHDGCQADCNLFWKDVWLKPVTPTSNGSHPVVTAMKDPAGRCSEAQLIAQTRLPDEGQEPRYACQATNLIQASESLPWWDLRQYLFDIVTRNHSAGHVLRALILASLRRLLMRVPFGYRLVESFYDKMHVLLTKRPSPWVKGKIPVGTTTPAGQLQLKPGEVVRIKTKSEIESTIDESCRNRGLSIDKEMASYCGSVATVRKSVERIIDESNGKMRRMKQPCIMLEGVFCNAQYSESRLMCPRAIPPYWREIWLDRVNGTQS